MPNDDEVQWFLPAALQISNPKVAAEAAELRKRLAPTAVSPFAHLSPIQFAQNRAKSRVQHLGRSLEAVTMQMRSGIGRHELKELQKAHEALRIRLAENLAILGEWQYAASVEPREEYRKEYLKHVR